MNSPFDTLLAVAAVGGRLGVVGDKLKVCLPPDCPSELKEAIRRFKPALIELMHLDFLLVRSQTLHTVVVWVPDEATKRLLINAGAKPANIYTRQELRLMMEGEVTANELPLIHEARRCFDGEVCPDPKATGEYGRD